MSELNLTIDGLTVKSQPGLSLLLATREHGIDIPTLCHHDDLKPEGHCRLCVVEIGPPGRTRLVNSCTYPVEEGLIVQTQSERVLASRRLVLELLLAQAPAAEVIQKMAAELGVYETRFKPGHPQATLHPLRPVRPHLPGNRRGQRHQYGLPHPEEAGGHALQRALRGLHRLRLLRLRLPHQRHRLHRKGRRPHRLGPPFRTASLHAMRHLHRPQGPTGTLGQTHRRPGGELLYLQGLSIG